MSSCPKCCEAAEWIVSGTSMGNTSWEPPWVPSETWDPRYWYPALSAPLRVLLSPLSISSRTTVTIFSLALLLRLIKLVFGLFQNCQVNIREIENFQTIIIIWEIKIGIFHGATLFNTSSTLKRVEHCRLREKMSNAGSWNKTYNPATELRCHAMLYSIITNSSFYVYAFV